MNKEKRHEDAELRQEAKNSKKIQDIFFDLWSGFDMGQENCQGESQSENSLGYCGTSPEPSTIVIDDRNENKIVNMLNMNKEKCTHKYKV